MQVVSFSGGRTSALMLKLILERYNRKDIKILFANTGKERNETYDFIHKIEKEWSIDVVWLEYQRIKTDKNLTKLLKTKRMTAYADKQDNMHWFKIANYDTAKRHLDDEGSFDHLLNWTKSLPNPIQRSCTAQLKIKTMQRYLWSVGIHSFVNHIGFRYDEIDRIVDIVNSHDRDKEVYYKFLLAEEKISQDDVNKFWENQPFNLQLKHYEGNCHLCFLKKRKIKQQLVREQPDLTKWWLDWEAKKLKKE